uniref:Dermatopontin n=1 Tax=Suberites domuncula TaxID=55567 RepID=Q966Y2_SUBDO|nr:dermatopontin [Suberites domuncula]
MKMFVNATVGLFVLVLALHAVAAFQYQNDYDKPLHVECPDKQALYYVQSIHSNRHEDRRFRFNCKHAANKKMSHCFWTGHLNNYDGVLNYQCPPNNLMTGVKSEHSNHHEDRRWSFKCCKANGYHTKSCLMTGYINSYDNPMHHAAHYNHFFAGAYSVHSNHHEDRIWKMYECKYSKIYTESLT